MSATMNKPKLQRRTTLEYDRSLLCPLVREVSLASDVGASDSQDSADQEQSRGTSLLLDGSHPSETILDSPLGPPLATKSYRSALGTAAFKKTTAELAELNISLQGLGLGAPRPTAANSDGAAATADGIVAQTDNLQRIVDSICVALEDPDSGYGTVGTYRHRCEHVDFEPRGCTWHATVVSTSVEGDDKEEERNALATAQANGAHRFKIRVRCEAVRKLGAKEEEGDEAAERGGGGEEDEDDNVQLGRGLRPGLTRGGLRPGPFDEGGGGGKKAAEEHDDDDVAYMVNVDLLPDDEEGLDSEDGSDLMVDFGGRPTNNLERRASYKDRDRIELVKKVFDEVALDVKKAIVKCEMPEFPEGCKGRQFREIYQLNARLKSGSFATVCRGTHRATGKKVAIKCVLRKDMPPSDDAAIYDEVSILASLKHRYICPLIDFFEEKECYFLVMELMSGGDLFDRIGHKKSYDESDARDLCKKMLEAMKYCHDHSIAHCDMKPKNLLLKDEENDSFIKLADFGFATRVYGPNSLTKQCGTPFFVAPEILMRSPYDQQADMWSVGVIIYLLLSGNLPFMGRSQRELFRAIVVGKYDFPEDEWSEVSDHAKELIRGLLVTDPAKRLTAKQAIASRWMRDRGDLLRQHSLMFASQRLKTFNARMKLRSAMINIRWMTSSSVWNRSSSGSGGGISSTSLVAKIKEQQAKEAAIEEENSKDMSGTKVTAKEDETEG